MNYEKAKKICENFAKEHKIIFEEKSECGFGRECVGFLHGDMYVDHNPVGGKDYMPIKEFVCEEAQPPNNVDAYHKHDCLAVLGRGEEAIIQLASWILNMQEKGKVMIVDYQKNPDSMLQALITGAVGKTVMIEKK